MDFMVRCGQHLHCSHRRSILKYNNTTTCLDDLVLSYRPFLLNCSLVGVIFVRGILDRATDADQSFLFAFPHLRLRRYPNVIDNTLRRKDQRRSPHKVHTTIILNRSSRQTPRTRRPSPIPDRCRQFISRSVRPGHRLFIPGKTHSQW